MTRQKVFTTMAFALALASASSAFAQTPSTNDENRALGWAHVNQLEVGIGYVTLEFVSPRGFWSCFEYRSDGDTSQSTGNNPNTLITDGFYPYFCLNNNRLVTDIVADGYVEVRMVFGGESDERFTWTRFEVLPDAASKEDCDGEGWMTYGFRNQGVCIQFVNTGKDDRVN